MLPVGKQSQNEEVAGVSWLSSATWSKTNHMIDFVISILILKNLVSWIELFWWTPLK